MTVSTQEIEPNAVNPMVGAAMDDTMLDDSMAASLAGNTTVLTPPYPGTYQETPPRYLSPYFRWYIVKKPWNGEAVVQLGKKSPTHYSARARGGFKHVYTARATGYHNIWIDVAPKPITRKYGAQVSAIAFVWGVRGSFRSVPVYSWRQTRIDMSVPLVYGRSYQIVVAGQVYIPPRADSRAYGEFIGVFPKIAIKAPYYAASADEEELEVSFEKAITEHASLEEMSAAFAKDDKAPDIHVQDLTAEEVEAAGEEGFVTASDETEAS